MSSRCGPHIGTVADGKKMCKFCGVAPPRDGTGFAGPCESNPLDMYSLLAFAASAGSRAMVDTYAQFIRQAHLRQDRCTRCLSRADSKAVLEHVANDCAGQTKKLVTCRAMWKDDVARQADDYVAGTLDYALHVSRQSYMYQGPGNLLFLSARLEPIELKWLLRYFLSQGYTCRIVELNGSTRTPSEYEINWMPEPPSPTPSEEDERTEDEGEQPRKRFKRT